MEISMSYFKITVHPLQYFMLLFLLHKCYYFTVELLSIEQKTYNFPN